MKAQEAFKLVASVISNYKGTLEDHKVLQTALEAIKKELDTCSDSDLLARASSPLVL